MEHLSTEAATQPARAPAPQSLKDLRGPRPWPVLGNLPQLDLPRMHETLERWADEYGPLYRLTLGGRPIVVLADGPLIAGILRDRPDGWRRIGVIASVINEMGGDGVFTAEGDDWRRQRRLVMSAFDPGHLARFSRRWFASPNASTAASAQPRKAARRSTCRRSSCATPST